MTQPPNRIIYDNVELGTGTTVGPFVVVGEPARGKAPGEMHVRVGADGVIRSHTVIYGGVVIGDRFQSGHRTLIREDTNIGDDCSVGSGSVIEFCVRMADRVRCHSNVFVPEHSVLEHGCWLGPNVVVTNARFPSAARTKETLQGVTVGAGAKIGANATLLPGVSIGAGALVGAGSVVTKDVAPNAVVAGNPARQIGTTQTLRYADTGELVYG